MLKILFCLFTLLLHVAPKTLENPFDANMLIQAQEKERCAPTFPTNGRETLIDIREKLKNNKPYQAWAFLQYGISCGMITSALFLIHTACQNIVNDLFPYYAMKGNTLMMKRLMRYPLLNTNHKFFDKTALMWASSNGDIPCIYLLLGNWEIDPAIQNSKKKTAIHYLLFHIDRGTIKKNEQKKIYALLYKRYDLLFHGYLRKHGIDQASKAALLTYIPYALGRSLHQNWGRFKKLYKNKSGIAFKN